MLGEFINSILVIILGFAYPAFECFKTLEKNRVDMSDLRFWCQYWIIVSILSVVERFGDIFISWVPMYAELKLAFIIYLWYPKTKGTSYVYESLLRPFVARHETDIDKHLRELRLRAWDLAIYYWQNCTELGQGAFFQVIEYLINQSSRLKGGGGNSKKNIINWDQPKGQGPPRPPPPALPRDFIPQSPLSRANADHSASSLPHHRTNRRWALLQPSAPPMPDSLFNRSVSQPTKAEVVQVEPDEARTEHVHIEEDEAQGMGFSSISSPKKKAHLGWLTLRRSKQQ